MVLKGDLPIGVDRNSVDTWVYPNLFRMNTSTGAPPDYFDKNGQNWGFPTYNWEEMSKENYAWWRARLTQVLQLTFFILFPWSIYLKLLILLLMYTFTKVQLSCFIHRWENTSQLIGLIIYWVSLEFGNFLNML